MSYNVLLIEDDKWLADQYVRIIKKHGYEVTVSASAERAISIIDDNLPDVIILDILLTGSTAFALLNELQSYDDTCNIPIIICSTLSADLSMDRLSGYGVGAILDKTTMSPIGLVEAIKKVI